MFLLDFVNNMKMKLYIPKRRISSKGSILIYALTIISIIMIVGLTMAQMLMYEARTTSDVANSSAAYAAAQSGIDYAINKKLCYLEKQVIWLSQSNKVGFILSYDPVADVLTSTGIAGGIQRQINIPHIGQTSKFGTGGMVRYDSGSSGLGGDMLSAAAMDSDGNIYAFGNQDPGRTDWVILKYNRSGIVDTSFGVNGKIIYDAPPVGASQDIAQDIVIDSQNNIYVSGITAATAPVVRKYTSKGVLVTSFGTNGNIRPTSVDAMVIDSSDNIYVGGGTVISKYNSSGILVNSFGNAGKLTLTSYVHSMTLNKITSYIYTAGYVMSNLWDWGVQKFNTDGQIDNNFGTGGLVTYGHFNSDTSPSQDQANEVAIDSKGKIYVIGIYGGYSASEQTWAIRKYDPNGVLDTTFGSGGMVTYNGPQIWVYEAANVIKIDGTDHIYAGGRAALTDGYAMAVLKYDSNGVLDTTFGTAGMAYFTGGMANDLIIDNYGNILVFGTVGANSASDIVVRKYTSNGQLFAGCE